MCFNIKIADHSNLYLCNIYIYDTRRLLLPGSPGKRGLKRENFNHATTMVVVLRTVAAQHRAHHAKPAPPAGFYILCVELIATYQSNSCIHCIHTRNTDHSHVPTMLIVTWCHAVGLIPCQEETEAWRRRKKRWRVSNHATKQRERRKQNRSGV